MAGHGRPKVKKRFQRRNAPFLTKEVNDINAQIRKAYVNPFNKDTFWDNYTKINSADAEDCYRRHKGKCAFCDQRLKYLGRRSINAAKLMFYVPLDVGGEARPDNLIVVCSSCKHDYRSTKKLSRDIEGLDSFADTCEALFKAVKDGASEGVRAQLKARLNDKLVDVATCMRYVTTSDWEPDHTEVVVEGENTMGERLEQMAQGEDVKAEITNDVKQIVKTNQYTIIRRAEDEST
jgi:hypothetical protein